MRQRGALPGPIPEGTLPLQRLLKVRDCLSVLALSPMRDAEPIQQGAFPRPIPEGPAERKRRLILRSGVGIGKPLFQLARPGRVELRQR